jgi:hypothetical protein
MARTYMAELRSLWLQPCADTLTTLVLYQSDWFGYFPKLDLRVIRFSYLHTLALGRYTFTHDWQLDWLSSCSPVLKRLYLDHCIVVFYTITGGSFPEDDEGYPVPSSPAVFYMYKFRFIDLTYVFPLLYPSAIPSLHDRQLTNN